MPQDVMTRRRAPMLTSTNRLQSIRKRSSIDVAHSEKVRSLQQTLFKFVLSPFSDLVKSVPIIALMDLSHVLGAFSF